MAAAKRRIHQNIWGNWYGYLGTRRVEDFGLDEWNAFEWLFGYEFKCPAQYQQARKDSFWKLGWISVEK